MHVLKRVRPSNLIILCALPFIVYLFAASPDYGRSLKAIVGIEPGAARLVPGFAVLLLAFVAGLAALRCSLPNAGAGLRRFLIPLAALNLAAGAALALTDIALPFIASVVANSVDPFTSTLVVQGETPRRLTDEAFAAVATHAGLLAMVYLLLSVAGFGALAFPRRLGRAGRWLLGGMNGAGLAYLLFVAYLGFAAGVATSVRAAVLAYVLAVVLGLVWIGMMQLRPHRRTPLVFAATAALLAFGAFWQFSGDRHGYSLVGTLSGKIGVVKDTPDALIGAIQFGRFPGAPGEDVPVRSYADAERALAALAEGADVSAVFIPDAALPAGQTPIWQSAALPDSARGKGAALSVAAIITALLTIGGFLHQRHPLSVGAEFVIDTIRGIPMLVIVLYIGLPLSGAVKEASGGVIDFPNLVRGIVAMALAYSAYLAEIFRSGINAVPSGQIEAARSLGLTRWQTARLVIIPQAFRIIIPPLGNEFIAILKDTSLLSILSIRDITQRMREFQSASFLPFAPYNSAAIFYVLLTLVAASLIASVERRYDVQHRR